MYDVPMQQRPGRVREVIQTVRAAFTGEPFEYRGRTVHVTPAPFSPAIPILLGGSSEGAARRAARIADGFVPTSARVWEFYRDEVQALGRPDPGPDFMGPSPTIVLAEDPEAAWERIGPCFLHECNAYGEWQAQSGIDSPYHTVSGIDELRAAGDYAVLTPDQYVAQLQEAAAPFPFLHPLCGGMPIEVAWSSLRLFEHEVLPAFT